MSTSVNTQLTLATFDHEANVLRATEEMRKRGFHIHDVYSPYAIHGIDEAMGLKPSRLTWVCFVCGLIGALGMLWFQHWVNAVAWPIDVGGKPWNSLPAEAPVGFEMLVLCAAFGTVFAFFVVSRMFPGKNVTPINKRVTDDQFVLALGEVDASYSIDEIEEILKKYNVLEVEETSLE